jgi:hypothetical protein
MMRIGTTLTLLAQSVATAACQSPQQKIAGKEDLLTAAGFKFLPANTPQRVASFKQLPAHQFSRQIRDGRVFYVWPDPTVCACPYVRNQAAYAAYQKDVFEKQLANEQAMTATDMAMTWDWGPWGGWPYGWY